MDNTSHTSEHLQGPNKLSVCKFNGWGYKDTCLFEPEFSRQLWREDSPDPSSLSLSQHHDPDYWWKVYAETEFAPPLVDVEGRMILENDIETGEVIRNAEGMERVGIEEDEVRVVTEGGRECGELQTVIDESLNTGSRGGHSDRRREDRDVDTIEKYRHRGGGNRSKSTYRGSLRRIVYVTGNRYWFSGKIIRCFSFVSTLPGFVPLRTSPPQRTLRVPPIVRVQAEFENAVRNMFDIDMSMTAEERLFHTHGHTVEEIFTLRYGSFDRVPDAVVYPKTHEEVEIVVRLAVRYNVVLIPYGGGTSVTLALNCPPEETRMIVSVDVSRMNAIHWVDRRNLVACVGAGAVGECLENQLKQLGLTLGHEPDSSAFSTLGGWIATRCSGMKKNTYGNIEDMLVSATVVTPIGTYTTPNVSHQHEGGVGPSQRAEFQPMAADSISEEIAVSGTRYFPRVSGGPDLRHIILGSEGVLGVITKAVIKLTPLPEVRKYGSIAFPNFALGVQFMREVARRRLQPTSIRLMDNMQFKFGTAMRPVDPPTDGSFPFEMIASSLSAGGKDGSGGWRDSAAEKGREEWLSVLNDYTGRVRGHFERIYEAIKAFFLYNVKGFDESQMVGVTLLFEGEKKRVESNEQSIYRLCREYQGLPGGSRLGQQGYNLTFMIAYIRDFVMDYHWIFESFETSVCWDRVRECCDKVRVKVYEDCKAYHVRYDPVLMIRMAQVYDEGPCLYFYLGFNWMGLNNPMKVYGLVEDGAREVIMDCGGCISHHHGVGKLRKKFMKRHAGEFGISLLKSIKKQLDPTNILASGNLI
eukprot:GHVQ01034574.1.p1 GENE.GHVQ01034574.1~~GHVQ01034574.1.p1  ORF type:complete len:808 (+),score=94.83 GHVQ01034574.1:163-2586(+)